MKPSHIQTPRTSSECQFTTGYPSVSLREPLWEKVAGYLLAFGIGCALAAVLVIGLSK